MDGSGTPRLRVRGLEAGYGRVQVLFGLDLEVAPGEAVAVLGANGAGKTTLLRAISGLLTPTAGSIALDGEEVGGMPPYKRARRGITRTFQMTSEFAKMTAFENLVTAGHGAEGASLRNVVVRRRRTRAAERAVAAQAWSVLDRFEMAHVADLYGAELSGGQRRLVEIMRCLMREPKVLLLDEPMVGVAPHLVDKLLADLRSIRDDGIALVIVEHALEVVQELCERVVVMALGRPIAAGTFDEVVSEPEVQAAYVG